MTQEDPKCFTIPSVWTGGFYELLLCLGPPSERNIRSALWAIWHYPLLEGPHLDRGTEPGFQATVAANADHAHLYGTARIQGAKIPCGTYVMREERDSGERLGDFISFYFPLSSLSLIFPVGSYPFGSHEAATKWRPDVDAWLLQLLEAIQSEFTFEVGSIGFEAELTLEDAAIIKSGKTPCERFDGLVIAANDRFDWYPPTRHDVIRLS